MLLILLLFKGTPNLRGATFAVFFFFFLMFLSLGFTHTRLPLENLHAEANRGKRD